MTANTNGGKADTVLDALLASLAKASEYNHNDQVAPAAILWTAGGADIGM